jgi:hypothetical protein
MLRSFSITVCISIRGFGVPSSLDDEYEENGFSEPERVRLKAKGREGDGGYCRH